MKLIARQKIWLAIVIVANLLLWIIPSDVVEQIARDRHTMLGRYSRTHFSWIVGVTVISLVSFYVDWSTGKTYKRRWFQVIATLLFLVPALALVDFVLRTPQGGILANEAVQGKEIRAGRCRTNRADSVRRIQGRDDLRSALTVGASSIEASFDALRASVFPTAPSWPRIAPRVVRI